MFHNKSEAKPELSPSEAFNAQQESYLPFEAIESSPKLWKVATKKAKVKTLLHASLAVRDAKKLSEQ